jgi:hypothetical protein
VASNWLQKLSGIWNGGFAHDAEPELRDSFVLAPRSLESAIRDAGGNTSRVVRWIERDTGPAYRFTVPGSKAVAGWQALRNHVPASHHWPVILGSRLSIRCVNGMFDGLDPTSVADLLRLTEAVNVEDWQAQQFARNLELDPAYRRPHAESWPKPSEIEQPNAFLAPLETSSRKPYAQVWLGLLPVAHSWEAPAFMHFGDWNAIPPPEVHVAMHRRWHEEFGADWSASPTMSTNSR